MMVEGQFFGLDRPFVEEDEMTIKLIAEYSTNVTKDILQSELETITSIIEDKGYIVNKSRVDSGLTPFLVMEMGANNIGFSDLAKIRKLFIDVDGFKNLTISTVDLANVERLARKR